jgi:hypothetical protein
MVVENDDQSDREENSNPNPSAKLVLISSLGLAILIALDWQLKHLNVLPITVTTHTLIVIGALYSSLIAWRCHNRTPLWLRGIGLGHSFGSPFNSIGYLASFEFVAAIGYGVHIAILLGGIH